MSSRLMWNKVDYIDLNLIAWERGKIMISFIVGRGMGHLGRCIAIVNQLNAKGKKVRIYAFRQTHQYLKQNLHKKCHLKLYRKGKVAGGRKANVIIHDWRPEIPKLRKGRTFRNSAKMVSLYHSDFFVHRNDDRKMRRYKRHILKVANQTDVFLHMNVRRPRKKPKKLNCLYIPIPLISRKSTKSPAQVKKILGLKPNESFILVQMGSGLGDGRYSSIRKWYKVINHLAKRHRFVIAGQFKNEKFEFHKRIIQAPLFPNGKDLVLAADLVITKPGMGILVDCISTQTPILMLPPDTSERKQKVQMLKNIMRSNIAYVKKPKQLKQKIQQALKHRAVFKTKFKRIRTDGARVASNIISKLERITRNKIKKHRKQLCSLSPYCKRKK